jgi:hypothetical protein
METIIKGYLFENNNKASKAVLKGYLIIDNKKIYIVCFLNETKAGKKYLKIIERQKKNENESKNISKLDNLLKK